MALSHGSNDAQKAMGIVTMALVAYYANHPAEVPAWLDMASYHASKGKHLPNVPMWVIVACATAMALGTSAGGLAHHEDHGPQDLSSSDPSTASPPRRPARP